MVDSDTVKTWGSGSHWVQREGAQGGQEEFGCYRSSSAPHAANQLAGLSSASVGVVLEPERSRMLCVKSACQTQQRCHGGQSSARKVRRINSSSKRIPCVLHKRMAAMNYYSIWHWYCGVAASVRLHWLSCAGERCRNQPREDFPRQVKLCWRYLSKIYCYLRG